MSELLLVEHSLPAIDPGTASHAWRLSAEGERRCDWLAGALAARGVGRPACSAEPQARRPADPFASWEAPGFPSFVALRRPDLGWDGRLRTHPDR